MPASELASKIEEALNGNMHWPSRIEVPTTEDIHVGPLVFRYGGGYKRDRWYIAEDPRIGVCGVAGGHDYDTAPEDPRRTACVRPGCGYSYDAVQHGKAAR